MNAIIDQDLLSVDGRSWEDARDEVRGLLRLEADWDGEGADPVRRELIAPTLAFLQQSEASGFPPPEFVYATAGGSIMLEFHEPSGRVVAVNIRTVREAEVVTRTPGGKPVFRVVAIAPPSQRPGFSYCQKGKSSGMEFNTQPDPHALRLGSECADHSAELTYRLAS